MQLRIGLVEKPKGFQYGPKQIKEDPICVDNCMGNPQNRRKCLEIYAWRKCQNDRKQ